MTTANGIIEMLNQTNTAHTRGLSVAQIEEMKKEFEAVLNAGWNGLEIGTVVNYKGTRAMIKASENEISVVDLNGDAAIISGKIKGSYKTLQTVMASDANKEDSVAKSIIVKRMTIKSIW